MGREKDIWRFYTKQALLSILLISENFLHPLFDYILCYF